MRAKDCQAAYALGTQHSRGRHRSRGAYKLRQRFEEWQESEAEVHRIALYIRYPSARHPLRHCTNEDKAYWLRKILIYCAYELSSDVLPSFEALTGDGLSETQVKVLMPTVQHACSRAIAILENARRKITGNIKEEYRRMEDGKSVVEDSLVQVRTLMEGLIKQLPLRLQTEILT